MNNPTTNLPVVTSVFSLSIKQESDLHCIGYPESETSEQIQPPVTGSPNVKPDIIIRFKEEEFRTEAQGSEKRGNLPSMDICEELHETDNGFKNNSKRMRMYDVLQREEWKHKDPFRDSPDLSAEYEGGISSVTPTRGKEIAQNGERPNTQESNSNYRPRLVHFGGLREDEEHFKSTDTQENFTTDSYFVEHHISRLRTEVHNYEGIHKANPFGDTTNQEKTVKCFSQKAPLKRYEMSCMRHKPYKCSECDKCFSRKDNLQLHKMTHTGVKPFKCSDCDRCFIRKSDLQRHKMTHTGDKPFKCSECDKCFIQKKNLQLHRMTHTGDKPFKCSECNKCFSRKADLQRHKISHIEHKPFKCSKCDKCFSQKAHLQLHNMTHTGDKPFKCSDCDKSFRQKAHLQLHQNREEKSSNTKKCSLKPEKCGTKRQKHFP